MKTMDWAQALKGASGADVIYQPEVPEFGEMPAGMTRADFLSLCYGDEVAAQRLFEACDWEHPVQVLASMGGYEKLAMGEGGAPTRVVILGNEACNERIEVQVPGGIEPDDVEHVRQWLEETFAPLMTPQYGPAMEAAGFEVTQTGGRFCCQSRGGMARTESNFLTAEAAYEAMANLLTPLQRAALAIEPVPVARAVFSPEAKVSRDYPFVVSFSRGGEPLALIPAERYVVHASPLSPFALGKVASEFQDMQMAVEKTPAESSRMVALEQEFASGLAQDARYQRASEKEAVEFDRRMAWYRKHYGHPDMPCALSNNRGFAYVGPIIGESRFHFYQHDLVNDCIAMHYKLELAGEANVQVGQHYAVINTGGVRNGVQCLVPSVAEELAQRIIARRAGHLRPVAKQRICQLTGEPVTIDGPLPIRTTDDSDGYVRFWHQEEMVGYVHASLGPEGVEFIHPSLVSPDVAEQMSRAGLQIEFTGRGYALPRDELALAAFENLGWYAPRNAVSSDFKFMWDKKLEEKVVEI